MLPIRCFQLLFPSSTLLFLCEYSAGLIIGAGTLFTIFGIELLLQWVDIVGVSSSHSMLRLGLYYLGWVAHSIHEEIQYRGFWWYLAASQDEWSRNFNVIDDLNEKSTNAYQNEESYRQYSSSPKAVHPSDSSQMLACFLSSALFSLIHIQNPHYSILVFGNLFLLSLFLFRMIQMRRNLTFAASFHAAWNFSMTLLGIPVSGKRMDGSRWITVTLSRF
jgi:membrane protease YdiL (CAAX protease family)